ncbi:FAD dependent oxidoreductase-domain-containing protein [Colletotrichum phormii]|uniref:FAD dependent oxidoreductase-domain-containing protein n=1 Tax=Colletotrichum phormii TaxID=359342 RepID=A0AAI9ZZC3_9PEZI|nr:FAD dependent oxidoreductase-domain-containing protein [Colletotrichum phormii]KAK1641022.1 FAD dependent oxidoreductase-domain-containing protein [Colletotrichum phormii]
MATSPTYTATLPVGNSTSAFWQSKPDPVISNHQSHEIPTSADVVIIGAGISGAFIAHRLLTDQSPNRPKSVLMLEARAAVSGPTGRNGGHIKPDCYRGENGLEDEIDLVEYRSADVYLTENTWKAGLASYNGFKEAGGDVSEITVLSKAEAEETLRITSCYGAITFPASSLWPYKLAMAMIRKSLEVGLLFETNTPVMEVSQADSDSGSWTITTSRGNITTNKVIHATNGYASHLLPELDGRIIPLKGHVAAIAPPPAYVDLPLSTSFAFVSDSNYDYLVQRPGSQKFLIWGGGEGAHPNGPEGGYGDCDDSFTVPELPGKPGQYLIGGYHGHGMARVFLSTKIFCELFLGQEIDSRVPLPYFDLESRLKEPVNMSKVGHIL